MRASPGTHIQQAYTHRAENSLELETRSGSDVVEASAAARGAAGKLGDGSNGSSW